MSGIVGLWNRNGQPVDDDLLGRLCAPLAHRAIDGEDRHRSGAFAVAHQHSWVNAEEQGERQPLKGRRGSVVAFDGRLDNRAELLGALLLPRETSDAACVQAAYESWGDRFVERLNGDFALCVYDPVRPALLLARDVIGLRPLYYYRDQHRILFASEIKAILAHPAVTARPDNDGLADFLMLGARPLERADATAFAGVHGVLPAHLMVITPAAITSRRYWDFSPTDQVRLGSFEEYAEAFRALFMESVRRRMRSSAPVAVSVSGGLDSSSIFCTGAGLGPVVGISYTSDHGDADERQFLPDLEQKYSASILRIPMELLLGLVSNAPEQVRAVEAPFLDYMWGVTRAVRDAGRASGARVMLSGHWGDQVLFSPAYLVDLARRMRWREVRQHLREYPNWLSVGEVRVRRRRFIFDWLRTYVPRAAVRPLKAIRRRFFPEQKLKSWFAPAFLKQGLRFANQPANLGLQFHSAQARALYIEARSKYGLLCLDWNNKTAALSGIDVAFPFLDRDLLAFMMATPGEMQNFGGVPRAFLREAMRGVLPDTVRARSWKADFSVAVNSGILRDFDLIAAALSSDAAAVRWGYLRGDRLSEEVARLAKGLHRSDCVDSWDLADMFGLETWLRVFFNGAPAPVAAPAQLEETSV